LLYSRPQAESKLLELNGACHPQLFGFKMFPVKALKDILDVQLVASLAWNI
jgi:hypothetical protein